MNRYRWKWRNARGAWLLQWNPWPLLPPALAARLLRRRSGRWLLRGEGASGALAACPDEGCTGSEAKCAECRRGGGR